MQLSFEFLVHFYFCLDESSDDELWNSTLAETKRIKLNPTDD